MEDEVIMLDPPPPPRQSRIAEKLWATFALLCIVAAVIVAVVGSKD
jgi:hypothetical protein